MKIPPIRSAGAPSAPDDATNAVSGLHDVVWQAQTTLFDDPTNAALPAAAQGIIGDQSFNLHREAAVPSYTEGTTAPDAWLVGLLNPASDSFGMFMADADIDTTNAIPRGTAGSVDSLLHPATSDFGLAGFSSFDLESAPGATAGSFEISVSEERLASGQWQEDIGGSSVGAGLNAPIALPASNPEYSANAPNFVADNANHLEPSGAWISCLGSSPNLALGHNQSIAAIPDLKFVGPEGPEPVFEDAGTIRSSQSSSVQSSATVSAGSGINISHATTNANGSLTETVTFAGSGIVFNDTFDTSVSQAYKNCILSAEQTIASEWTNSVTINAEFTTQAEGQNGELAFNEFYTDLVSYATLKSALATLASQEPGDSYLQQAVAHLPSTDPSGGIGFDLTLPYARMLGLTSMSQSPDDLVTLNTSYNWSYGQDVINTVEHELSEGGLGRVGGLGDQNGFWSVMDLFRYNSSGAADYSDGRDGRTTYFSYNGGATLSSLSFNNEFNSHGQQVNDGDVADFVQQDVFGTGDPGETNTLSQTDIQVMEALGWNPGQPQQPDLTAYLSNGSMTASAGSSINLQTWTEQFRHGLLRTLDDGDLSLFHPNHHHVRHTSWNDQRAGFGGREQCGLVQLSARFDDAAEQSDAWHLLSGRVCRL